MDKIEAIEENKKKIGGCRKYHQAKDSRNFGDIRKDCQSADSQGYFLVFLNSLNFIHRSFSWGRFLGNICCLCRCSRCMIILYTFCLFIFCISDRTHHILHSVTSDPSQDQTNIPCPHSILLVFFGRAESRSNAVPVRLLSSSSVSVSESGAGTLSSCAAEVASARMCLSSSSVARAVVRAPTAFSVSSIRSVVNFLGGVKGSAAANSAADVLIYTLLTRQTG